LPGNCVKALEPISVVDLIGKFLVRTRRNFARKGSGSVMAILVFFHDYFPLTKDIIPFYSLLDKLQKRFIQRRKKDAPAWPAHLFQQVVV
jgi:hypothetical protein